CASAPASIGIGRAPSTRAAETVAMCVSSGGVRFIVKYFATKSSLYAQTAVELDDAAVQVIVLEDEGGRVRDLGRLAEALQRDPGRDLREYLRLHRRDHLGLDEAGRDRVHADAVLAELLRDRKS